jgi:adenosine deaminase
LARSLAESNEKTAALPKIELHLHLDCSLSYALVARLDPSISRADYERDFIAPPKCASLVDFLSHAPRGVQLMQSEQALRMATEDLFEQLAGDGVIYAEIRFAPLLHTERGLSAEQVVTIVDRATEECSRTSRIEARLILCTLRHFEEGQSMETVRLVEGFRGSSVVALDLAGDEAGFPLRAHIPAFRHAREAGLHCTAHAGEARGSDSVWETLRSLQPARIGHGARSIEDPELVEHLRRERIHLEICPVSNVQTGLCERYDGHPVDKLYRAGISVGINTDARTISNVTLTEEYERLRRHFGWGRKELLACNLEAVRAAFVPEPARERLAARLQAAYGVGELSRTEPRPSPQESV